MRSGARSFRLVSREDGPQEVGLKVGSLMKRVLPGGKREPWTRVLEGGMERNGWLCEGFFFFFFCEGFRGRIGYLLLHYKSPPNFSA